MKVNPNSNLNINYDSNLHKNNLSTQQTYLTNEVAKDNVSFGASLKGGVVKTFDWIDKKGFLVDFLIIDALSMIIPRILIGLGRDREKTGKINYKAGAEEAGREMISGPSMMLIPMGVLAIYKHFAPASQMKKNTLESFTQNMKNVIDETDSNLLTKSEKLNEKLADKLFDDAFGLDKLENKDELKSKFSKLLNESTTIEKKMFKNKEFNAKAAEFEKLIVFINNSCEKAPLDTKAIKLKSDGTNAVDLFEDFHNYSKDIVAKFTQKEFAKNAVGDFKAEAKTFVTNAQKLRAFTKFATAITGFLAVGTFLLYLPRVYQQGKVSPAMESAKRARQDAAKGGANENK